MKKMTIKVPKGVRYINQWEGFTLPDHPCIIDKQITGCGFTEYCLTNKDNVILCSPRKILLENKEEQHLGDVLYAKSGLDTFVNFEKDLTTGTKRPDKDKESDLSNEEIKDIITKFKNSIQQYYQTCVMNNKPCKILVTYDSFRHVKSALGDSIKYFYVVIDEFQSVFTDAKFKSTTEIEFMDQLKNIQKLSFISATPYMDKYLEMLDEFKDLPFYQLDWESEDKSRVYVPKLNIHSCSRSILPAAEEVILKYLKGEFESTVILGPNNEVINIESKEAVLYVNSVRNICDIIKRCKLTLDNTNVLCADTDENNTKVRKAFGLTPTDLKKKYGLETCLGKVPTKDQPRKMFTLCTRTVYLGADFYSDNARTFIFSDANIDSLTVDITIDLPQILGRQRLEENPWKNRAELYYKTLDSDKQLTQKDFEEILNTKKSKTESLLSAFNEVSSANKHNLAEAYQVVSKTMNYKDNYVAVNTHGGKDLIPTFNNLVMINDMRSYEIQQIDYKDRFRVFNALGEQIKGIELVKKILTDFDYLKQFSDKMKYLYSLHMEEDVAKQVLDNIYDTRFSKYYWTISASRAGTLHYRPGSLEEEYQSIINPKDTSAIESEVKDKILQTFIPGNKYLKSDIKETLRSIYESLGYDKTPKASDLEMYFELRSCQIKNKETGKKDHGFEIIKQKEE
jgi:hypothetical protein